MTIRAKHADAIREGIKAGRRTRYGDRDDPHYQLRSELIWGWSELPLRELALKAFGRTWTRLVEEKCAEMTQSERLDAEANFEHAHMVHVESREARQYRLLREEVGVLRERINQVVTGQDV